jgi:hypothetical protein
MSASARAGRIRSGATSPRTISPRWRRTRAKSSDVSSSPTATSRTKFSAGMTQAMSVATTEILFTDRPYRCTVNWTPSSRGRPGRPPNAGRGVPNDPVM